jgi:hypothetical protein
LIAVEEILCLNIPQNGETEESLISRAAGLWRSVTLSSIFMR